MKTKLTSLLTILHLILLGLFCFDFVSSISSSYEFTEVINHYINSGLVLSGFILLFITRKGEHLFYYYLFIYPIWFLGLIFFIVIDGGPASYFTSKHYLAQQNEITAIELKGFLAPCCTAIVYEQKFLVFQKSLGQVELPCIVEKSFQVKIKEEQGTIKVTCHSPMRPGNSYSSTIQR